MSSPDISPKPPKSRNQLSGAQVTFAAILAVGLALVISLSSRILAGQPLEQAYNRVLVEIDQLRLEQSRLITERDYVRSDAYVERWAREDGKMVREGEVLIIPVPSGANINPAPTPVPLAEIETTLPGPEPWNLWWALFFDSEPPKF